MATTTDHKILHVLKADTGSYVDRSSIGKVYIGVLYVCPVCKSTIFTRMKEKKVDDVDRKLPNIIKSHQRAVHCTKGIKMTYLYEYLKVGVCGLAETGLRVTSQILSSSGKIYHRVSTRTTLEDVLDTVKSGHVKSLVLSNAYMKHYGVTNIDVEYYKEDEVRLCVVDDSHLDDRPS